MNGAEIQGTGGIYQGREEILDFGWTILDFGSTFTEIVYFLLLPKNQHKMPAPKSQDGHLKFAE